jgi:hypothetical protein
VYFNVKFFQKKMRSCFVAIIRTLPPTEEISAVRRGRGEKIVSDNSKCIRTSKGGRGVNFLFGGGMDVFWNDPLAQLINVHKHT